MKKVLIISYYWPPTGGSGVQRWVKFTKYLPSMGWQPVIYTPENPEQLAVDESLLKEIPEGTEVIRTHITEPYEMYRRLFGKGQKSQINPINSGSKTFKQSLSLWIRGNFFIPDPRCWWVRPSVKFLKEYLKEHPVDAIVTTGPPQSMHLIGKALHRELGTPWIADFRDPWTKMYYFKHLGLWPLARFIHRKMEQAVLDEASAVIAVTPMVQADFQAQTSTPVALITNGYDIPDFPEAKPLAADREYFTIVHTGLLASDGNPLELWNVLLRKCFDRKEFRHKLKIKLIGKVDPEIIESIEIFGLGPNLENMGYLPHDRTIEEQRNADMLILPLRQDEEYRKAYPGKIFEYLAARRPVLGIGQEDSVSAELLRSTGAGDMYDWDKDYSIRKFVDREWDRFLAGDGAPVGSDISAYSREALTAKLVDLLNGLS